MGSPSGLALALDCCFFFSYTRRVVQHSRALVGSPRRGVGLGMLGGSGPTGYICFLFIYIFFCFTKNKLACCCVSFSNDGSLQKLAYAAMSSQHTVFFSKR
jgi:hypothetical protein